MSTPEDKSAALTSYERGLANKLADNPMDLFSGKTVGWLEDFIRITVGTGTAGGSSGTGSTGLGRAYYVPGDLKIVALDLTAQTGVYVYEDDSGNWLYLNGAAASQTTYADLYAFWGPNAWGADSGGNFLLPDARSRALYFCGTHADADLGDSDGITLASRRPKHQHTFSGVSVSSTGSTSSDSAGTPAGSVSGTVASHSHGGTGAIQGVNNAPSTGGTGFTGGDRSDVVHANQAESPAWSGSFTGSALSGHSHTVSVSGTTSGGTAGSGMALDAPPYLHIGSLVVRF